MDPKTYTIISDKGGGVIFVKESCANGNVAVMFFTTIKDIKGQILSEPVIQIEFFVAQSSEKAYADSCEWIKTNIDQKCKFEERHNAYEDLISELKKCGASQKNG